MTSNKTILETCIRVTPINGRTANCLQTFDNDKIDLECVPWLNYKPSGAFIHEIFA